jgi:hypothetical protein
MAAAPSILYLGGYGRSGSTVLGRVLGEAAGGICVGETRYLWSRGLKDDVRCGCGESFRECEFWTAVGDEAFGGWGELDVEAMVELDRRVVLLRTLPLHWAPAGVRPTFGAAVDAYAAALERLYRAIAAVTGKDLIVDTSKEPNFAAVLTRMTGPDLRIVHLVRDSRAVAFSWSRLKPEAIGTGDFMPRFGVADTAGRWSAWNLAFHALSRRRPPYMQLNYEDFVADPAATIERLGAFADRSLEPAEGDLREGRVRLGEHHIFSGNPMRSQSGWTEIRPDDRWQTAQSERDFTQVTAITLPLLHLYGYPTVPAGRRR